MRLDEHTILGTKGLLVDFTYPERFQKVPIEQVNQYIMNYYASLLSDLSFSQEVSEYYLGGFDELFQNALREQKIVAPLEDLTVRAIYFPKEYFAIFVQNSARQFPTFDTEVFTDQGTPLALRNGKGIFMARSMSSGFYPSAYQLSNHPISLEICLMLTKGVNNLPRVPPAPIQVISYVEDGRTVSF